MPIYSLITSLASGYMISGTDLPRLGHSNATATAYYIHLLPENLVKSSGIDWASLGKIYPDEELWKE